MNAVHQYVQDYEFTFDGGQTRKPTADERAMIEDAINGYVPIALSEESGRAERYRAALEDLAAFLPGYGDVAEVAAEKCRRALYPLPEEPK